MNSIESILGMIRTDAVQNGGMTDEQVKRYGPSEELRTKDSDEMHLSIHFPSLVRYVNEDGTERYEWVD